MKDRTRNIVMKIRLNEEEAPVIRKACAKVGKTFSAFTRELLLQSAAAPAHRMPRGPQREGAKRGPVSMRFPMHRAGACRPMRL
ncbi:hypothetical protein [Massilia sp. TN1-12]|uniref:hypothetical protein n=1 Tax=Massilia paldalensis TaxID=3377675 RepID=UPI00384BEFC3